MKENQNPKNQNREAINLFGKFIRIPIVLAYCFSCVLVGAFVGCVASVALPIFIPYQMIRIRYFK